jgi:hypothetical protein
MAVLTIQTQLQNLTHSDGNISLFPLGAPDLIVDGEFMKDHLLLAATYNPSRYY